MVRNCSKERPGPWFNPSDLIKFNKFFVGDKTLCISVPFVHKNSWRKLCMVKVWFSANLNDYLRSGSTIEPNWLKSNSANVNWTIIARPSATHGGTKIYITYYLYYFYYFYYLYFFIIYYLHYLYHLLLLLYYIIYFIILFNITLLFIIFIIIFFGHILVT